MYRFLNMVGLYGCCSMRSCWFMKNRRYARGLVPSTKLYCNEVPRGSKVHGMERPEVCEALRRTSFLLFGDCRRPVNRQESRGQRECRQVDDVIIDILHGLVVLV